MPKRWQDLAPPDDPNSWHDCRSMWPTIRHSYETADASTGTNLGSGYNAIVYAFAYGTDPSTGATQEYIVVNIAGGAHVHSWDGTTLTNQYADANPPSRAATSMVRYGNVALATLVNLGTLKICAATSFSAGFAVVAGAPTSKNILCVQSNAVLAFYTGDNSWATSDVGDHTNWTTGEASSGSIITQPGNVNTAVAWGNDVYAFKQGSIHRFTYVGGSTIKWNVQTAWVGNGVPKNQAASPAATSQDWAVATNHGIAFYGGGGKVYLFDGASAPKLLNPLTTIPVETIGGVFVYDAANDMLCIAPSFGSDASGLAKVAGSSSTFSSLYYYYNFAMDAWGTGVGNTNEVPTTTGIATHSGVLRGDTYSRFDSSSKPVFWGLPATLSAAYRNAPSAPASGASCYLQTKKYGISDQKTAFERVIPLLRNRTNLGSGSASLSFELFREREDTAAQATNTIAEASNRKRFDLTGGTPIPCVDNFGRFKVTWSNLDVEVDDFKILSKKGGID